jgi:precorrin-6B methylase 2
MTRATAEGREDALYCDKCLHVIIDGEDTIDGLIEHLWTYVDPINLVVLSEKQREMIISALEDAKRT